MLPQALSHLLPFQKLLTPSSSLCFENIFLPGILWHQRLQRPFSHFPFLILVSSAFNLGMFWVHFFLLFFLVAAVAAAAAKSLQSCPTLCDLIDSSPPGSPVPGILQARTLEWVAISFSDAWEWKVKVKSLSRVWLCATPWTAAHQALPSVGFSRPEYCSGLPLLLRFFLVKLI